MREAIGQPVRPIFASPAPATDAYRIFVDAIADTAADTKPNLAVIRLDSVRDRDMVCSMVRRAEAEAGVLGLPMIIISPKGDLALDANQMEGRPVRLLPSPTSVSLFCDVARDLLTTAQDAKGSQLVA